MLLPLWLVAGALVGVAVPAGIFFVLQIDQEESWSWGSLGLLLLSALLLLLVARRIQSATREQDTRPAGRAALVHLAYLAVFFVGLLLSGLIVMSPIFQY